MGLRVEGVSADTPASQTLSVWSTPHETMVEPSGENCTAVHPDGPLRTYRACAFCFSAFSSKDAAASTEAVRFG